MQADGTGVFQSARARAGTCDGVADADVHADPEDTAMSPMPIEQRLAVDAREADVQVVRQPVIEAAVDDDAVELGGEAGEEPIAQPPEARALRASRHGKSRRPAEPDDARHVERARPERRAPGRRRR